MLLIISAKHKVDIEDESSVQAQQSRGLWVRDQILSEQIETNKGGGVLKGCGLKYAYIDI